MLRDVNKKAFPILKGVMELVSSSESTHGRHTLHLSVRKDIKPGISKVIYNGWECEELKDVPVQRQGDPSKVLKCFQEAMQRPEFAGKDKSVIDPLTMVASFVGSMKDTKPGDPDNLLFQNYGPLLAALNIPGLLAKRPHIDDEDTPCSSKMSRSNSGSNVSTSDRDTESQNCNANSCFAGSNVDQFAEQRRRREGTVVLWYRSKASKDFIPAFALTRCPDCIIQWCATPRKWPSPQFVDRIRNCRYYVVAKPAVKDPIIEKDFCLGCNEAELLLAEAMLPVQRKCMLVIKAYQKSVLDKYSDTLTTFHWKTALYRVSQNTDVLQYDVSHPNHMADTPDNVMILVSEVVQYMLSCICECKLEHVFCDSNLFAGFDANFTSKIVESLVYLQENLQKCLTKFFQRLEDEGMKSETIPLSTVYDITQSLQDQENKSEVESIATLLSGIAEMHEDNDSTKMNDALIDVLVNALPYLVEEMTRGDPEAENRRRTSNYVSKEPTMDDLLNSALPLLTANSSRRDKKQAREKLTQCALGLLFKR